jgi:hypothetical protein
MPRSYAASFWTLTERQRGAEVRPCFQDLRGRGKRPLAAFIALGPLDVVSLEYAEGLLLLPLVGVEAL